MSTGQLEDVGFTEACVEVDDGTGFLFGGTYMFNERWGLDILAALPIEHDIDFEIYGLEMPDVGVHDVGGRFGSVEQLPPTVTVQYHFAQDSTFQPYFGVGLNWTTFSSEKYQRSFGGVAVDELDVLGIEKMYIDDSFGVAAQLGGDWAIGDHTVVNFDVRYIDIDADLAFSGEGFDGKEKSANSNSIRWYIQSVSATNSR